MPSLKDKIKEQEEARLELLREKEESKDERKIKEAKKKSRKD